MQAGRRPVLAGAFAARERTRLRPAALIKGFLIGCVCLYCLAVAGFLWRQESRPAAGGGSATSAAEGGAIEQRRAAALDLRRREGLVDAPPERYITFLVCKVSGHGRRAALHCEVGRRAGPRAALLSERRSAWPDCLMSAPGGPVKL